MVSTNKGYFFSIPSLLIAFFVFLLAVTLIVWDNNPLATPDDYSNLTWVHINGTSNNTIGLLITKFVNFFGESVMIIAQEVIRWSYNNQEVIDGRLLLNLIIISFLIPVIYPLFMISIVLFLLIREWYLNKKEKSK